MIQYTDNPLLASATLRSSSDLKKNCVEERAEEVAPLLNRRVNDLEDALRRSRRDVVHMQERLQSLEACRNAPNTHDGSTPTDEGV